MRCLSSLTLLSLSVFPSLTVDALILPDLYHAMHLIHATNPSPLIHYPSDSIHFLFDQLVLIAPYGSVNTNSLITSIDLPTIPTDPDITVQSALHILNKVSDSVNYQFYTLRIQLEAMTTTLVPNSLEPISSTSATIPSLDISPAGNLIKEVITAPIRATSAFSTQLIQKGELLATNTQSSIKSFATDTPQLVKTSWEGALFILRNGVSKLSSSLTPIEETLLATSDTLNQVASAINAEVAAIGRWRLFSDDNHWETGYWERRITSLQKLLVELEKVDNRRKYLDGLAGAVSESVGGVGSRFVDQYNIRRTQYSDFDAQVVAALGQVKGAVEQAGRTAIDYVSDERRRMVVDAIDKSVDGFTSRFVDQYNIKRAEYRAFDEAVISLWDLLKNEADSTAQGIQSYVHDFIVTGEDL